MCRTFKTAMLSLLLFALPLQGMAAATLELCGAVHQRMTVPGQKAIDAVPDHPVHHHGAMAATGSAEQDSPPGTHETPSDKYNCSACAVCCTGAAISGPGYRAPDTVFTAEVLVPSSEASSSSFVPEGPEHPPRPILV
jgi:hypothetical protein